MTALWEPCHQGLFFSRNDKSDPRLGDFVTGGPNKPSTALIVAGYPDDEGISLNGGRKGAALAPDQIRKYFYKMTPDVFTASQPELIDKGNLRIQDMTLEKRHAAVANSVMESLKAGHKWVGLGGGHDYGYSDGAGFLRALGNKRPLVINFDAHLDVRPTNNGPTSGTPFFRLLEEFSDFELVEVGIQSQCNSRTHLQWAKDRGVKILSYDQLAVSGLSLWEALVDLLGEGLLSRRPTYLSIDLDGFSSAFAPGCSQSFATGFEPREFFLAFDNLCRRLDVRVLGLYEVSPPLDQDDRTSKLAAQILHRYAHLSA